MFGPISLTTIQAWNVLESSSTREDREWAIAELSTAYNAYDHIKHRLGNYFVRAASKEYVIVRDEGTGETEIGTLPLTRDGLRMATFNATVRALREILQ